VPDLRFLADMNISPLTVQELKERGWNVARVSDVLQANARDEDILSFPSVISLRLEEPNPLSVVGRLVDVVLEIGGQLTEGIIVSVDESCARYRKLPIDSETE
jgi:hypothetical protein